ncbi:hypothetical protein [Methylomonas sp. AM2-LC]|uniref:hypothetical protein n=1 Tax=Methylomonas sp. AM2-LC TaxID=3153301 RepID=UPI0032644FEB
MKKAVFCIAKDISQTEIIVNQLKSAGFSSNDISVLLPDKNTSKDFAYEKHTKAPEGASVGGTLGLGVGAVLGWLVGIGSLAIPGVGPFIAAGPIMAALSVAAVGAAAGGLTGALIGVGMPEFEAKRYEGKIKGGCVLISVHAANSAAIDQAKEIFEEAHAEDISSTVEAAVSA